MKKYSAVYIIVSLFVCSRFLVSASQGLFEITQIHIVAIDTKSLFLNKTERVQAVDTFLQLVHIKGPNSKEQKIQNERKG